MAGAVERPAALEAQLQDPVDRALQQALTSGRMPGDEVTDAILVMVGGALLVLPGFVSDVVGLLHLGPTAVEPPRDIIDEYATPLLGGLAFAWSPAFPAVLAALVVHGLAAIKVSAGEPYSYPFTWRLIK